MGEDSERTYMQMEQDRIDNEKQRLDLVSRELSERIRVEDKKNDIYAKDVDSVIETRKQQTAVGGQLASALHRIADALGGNNDG